MRMRMRMRIVFLVMLIMLLKYIYSLNEDIINTGGKSNKFKCKQISKLSLKSNFPRHLLFSQTVKNEPIINKKSLDKIILSKTKGIQAYQSGEYSEFEEQ